MSAWKRPGKNTAPPPPLYADEQAAPPYCHTCGRVISRKKPDNSSTHVVKYCSASCRSHKPGPIDRKMEQLIAEILDGTTALRGNVKEPAHTTPATSGGRAVVSCDEIERVFFDRPEQTSTAPSAERTYISGDEAPDKQKEGQKRAEEREMVRRAARRAVVFGVIPTTAATDPSAQQSALRVSLRKCEAVQNGVVVEPSFAKGDWSIRWR